MITPKTVDSYRFLSGVAKIAMKRWAGIRVETSIPWTPLGKPLSQCTVSLVSSAALALKTDVPFDAEVERHDPWFSDPSYRVLPQSTRTGDVRVFHLHIDPGIVEEDLNTALPLELLAELAASGEIGAAAPSHYSYYGYTLRPERLLRESVPEIARRLRDEHVDVVVLVPI